MKFASLWQAILTVILICVIGLNIMGIVYFKHLQMEVRHMNERLEKLIHEQEKEEAY